MQGLQHESGMRLLKRWYHKAAFNLKKQTLADIILHPVAWLTLAALSITFSALIVKYGILSVIVILAGALCLPFVYTMLAYPRVGIIILLTSAYLVMFVEKVGGHPPVGVFMDGLELLLFAGFFLKHKYDKSWAFTKSPVSVFLLLWVGYNFIEIVNPVAASRVAWLFTIRTVAIVTLTYFIFLYYINTVAQIRLILKLWIGLSLFAALYTLKQEYFGFSAFEKVWLADNPSASSLYFIGGHWRKFSIFSDPVALAYNMVISMLLCFSLLFSNIKLYKKAMLSVCMIIFVMAMLYSGTRGAFVLVPAGMAIIFILKLDLKTFIVGVIVAAVFLVAVNIPTSNQTFLRFQSAFKPSDDASYNVRKVNQKRIQPYIKSHPMGGGLGSTGTWGQRFSPNTYLASFPPDSGFIRVAVETGWIGLILLSAFLFTALKTGISNYFQIKDTELKTYCLAMTAIIFSLTIGNFPQEALVQFPINIYFYLALALIIVTLRLDRQKQSTGLNITVN
jgi:putative inorganic carbon (HCO3(-)) transporter